MEFNTTLAISLLVIFSIWALWLVPTLAESDNTIAVYFIFTAIYVYASMWFLGFAPHEVQNGFKLFFGWFIVFLVFDIVALPFLLNRDFYQEPPQASKLASDYTIYSLLPSALPHIIRYIITYVLVPTFLIFVAYLVLGKRKFETAVRENV